MSLKIKFRETIPAAIIGGVLTVILLWMTTQMFGIDEGSYFGAAVAFLVGGFIAGYFATKDLKVRLGHAVAAGMLSGLAVIILAVALILVSATQLGVSSAEAFMFIYEVGLILLTGLFVSVGFGGVGGLIAAWLLGFGKSELLDAFKKTKEFLKKEYIIGVVVLVFYALSYAMSYGFESLGMEGDAVLALTIVSGVLGILFTAAMFTGVIRAVKKSSAKETIWVMLVASIMKCKHVLAGLVIAGIPVVAVVLVNLYVIEEVSLQNEFTGAGLLLLNALLVLYIVFASFVPQAIVLQKKNALEGFKASLKFVRKNLLSVLTFFVLLLAVLFAVNIVFTATAMLVNATGFDSTEVFDFVFGFVSLTISIVAQTFYFAAAVKK